MKACGDCRGSLTSDRSETWGLLLHWKSFVIDSVLKDKEKEALCLNKSPSVHTILLLAVIYTLGREGSSSSSDYRAKHTLRTGEAELVTPLQQPENRQIDP